MSGKGKSSNSSEKTGQQRSLFTNDNDVVYITDPSSFTQTNIYALDGNDVIYGSEDSYVYDGPLLDEPNDVKLTSTTPLESIYGGNGNDWINAGGGYKEVYTQFFDVGDSLYDYTFDENRADYMSGDSGPSGKNSGNDWVSFQPFGSPNGSGLVSYTDYYDFGVIIDLSDSNGDNYAFGLDSSWTSPLEDSASLDLVDDFLVGLDPELYAIGTADGFENVWGSNSEDWITGSDSNNNLHGADGEDWLSGGLGDDELNGGSGEDLLTGGEGSDKLTGGCDSDYFDFTDLGNNDGPSDFSTIDVITDFESGTDLIVFSSGSFSDGSLANNYVEDLTPVLSLNDLALAATISHDSGAEYYFGVYDGNGYLFADDVGDGWDTVIMLMGITDINATDIVTNAV